MTSYAIGIDLGTTFSCVAVYRNQKVEVIANGHGSRITPSVVCFMDAEILVGQAALEMLGINPTNVVYDSKRLIGRKYVDDIVKGDVKNYPFKVTNGRGNRCLISVERNEVDGKKTKRYTPEAIAAHILKNLKKTAEEFLSCKITEAVITVPAYFKNYQKQATKNAGEIAGLKVLKVLTEPTSAVIQYAHDNKGAVNGLVLVFHLGKGTLDVSIVRIDNSNIEVLSTSSDTHLGGNDFDSVILEYAIAEIMKKHNIDVSGDPIAKAKLKVECKKAKKTLSTKQDENIVVPSIRNGIDIQIKITKAKFNSLCSELFARINKPIDQALEEAKLTKNNIDRVLLVGGSTRVPRVKEQLGKYFAPDKIVQSINPDEAVAAGAAIHAFQMSSNQLQHSEKIYLEDVVPLPLGIKISEGRMHCIIDKNTKFPTRKTQKYRTSEDNQLAVEICVYEGESDMVGKNNKLGMFTLSGLQPKPKGEIEIEIVFDLNDNGILEVTAVEVAKNLRKTITIEKDASKMTQKELDKIIKEFQNDCKGIEEFKKAQELKDSCEIIVKEIEEEIEDKSDKYNLNSKFMSNAKTEIKTYINWANQQHTVLSDTEVKSKVNIVKNAIAKIVNNPRTFKKRFSDMTL
uniref:Heat shock protein 70 n=1 Tax=Rhabditophanes sp. KR3021 TaxID=114890 RepID=A0AC35TY77_9BILA